jgi:hypothetical protein
MSKFEMHRRTIEGYYRTHPDSLRIFVEIVKNRSTVVSLRLLDWFVTNFVNAPPFPDEKPSDRMKRIQLHFVCSQNLDAYSKVWFDPFARELVDKGSFKVLFDVGTSEITVSSDEPTADNQVSTTIGQLNFFRCAIEHGIIAYVFEHHSRIQAHMLEGLSKRKKSRTRMHQEVYISHDCDDVPRNLSTLQLAFSHDPRVHIVVNDAPRNDASCQRPPSDASCRQNDGACRTSSASYPCAPCQRPPSDASSSRTPPSGGAGGQSTR